MTVFNTLKLSTRYAALDMKGSVRHLKVFFLCLILGMATIIGVRSVGSSALGTLKEDGRILLGGDLALSQQYLPFSDDLKTYLHDQKIRTTEGILFRGVIRRKEDRIQSSLIEARALDSRWPLYGAAQIAISEDQTRTFLSLGSKLKPGEILIDQDLADRLQTQIDDILILGTKNFRVAGVIIREPDQLGNERPPLAPRAILLKQDAIDAGLTGPGAMITYQIKLALPKDMKPQALLDVLTRRFDDSDRWNILTADEANPRVQSFVSRFTLFLTLVGLTVLLIGGMGIANAVQVHMDSRMNRLAIFKALGMTRRMAMVLWFIQITGLGLIAIIIGIMAGLSLPYLLQPLISTFLPYELKIAIHVQDILLAFAVGLLSVWLFAWLPLMRAKNVAVADLLRSSISTPQVRVSWMDRAILSVFAALYACLVVAFAANVKVAIGFLFVMGGVFGVFQILSLGLLDLIGRVRHWSFPLTLRLALHGIQAPGNRTPQIILSLGAGLSVLVAIALIQHNIQTALSGEKVDDAPAFFFLDIQPDQKDSFAQTVLSVEGAEELKFSPNIRGRIDAVNGIPARQALKDPSESWLLSNDRGITYTATLPDYSEITQGQWWPQDYQGSPIVSIVDSIAEAFEVGPGDVLTIEMLGEKIEAEIANVRSADWTTFTINFTLTFAPGALEDIPQTFLATVRAPDQAQAEIQNRVLDAFSNITVIRLTETLEQVQGFLSKLGYAFQTVALLAIIAGIFVLESALSAVRSLRLKQDILMKVIGASKAQIIGSVMIEYSCLGFIAGAVSVGLGAIISWLVMTQLMDLQWIFAFDIALLTVTAAILLMLLVGFLGVLRVLSVSPAPWLRNE